MGDDRAGGILRFAIVKDGLDVGLRRVATVPEAPRRPVLGERAMWWYGIRGTAVEAGNVLDGDNVGGAAAIGAERIH